MRRGDRLSIISSISMTLVTSLLLAGCGAGFESKKDLSGQLENIGDRVLLASKKRPAPSATPVSTSTATPTETVVRVTTVSSSISSNSLVAGQVQTVRVTLNSATNLSNLIIDIRILNSSGQIVARKPHEGASLAAGVATPFQFDYQSPTTLAAGSYKAIVGVWNSTWATTYLYSDIGAFSVVTGTTAPAPTPAPTAAPVVNLVMNSGFENGLASFEDWGNLAVVTGQSASGSYALRVGMAAGGSGQRIVGKIVAGTAYRFSLQGKVGLSTEDATFGFSVTDSAGTELLEQTGRISSTSYQTHSFDFVAPAGAVNASVFVWKNAGSSYLYVDDFSLVSASGTAPAPGPTPAPTPVPAPTPITSGQGYPFGSRRTPYVAGIRPTNVSQADQDQAVISLYNKWKTTLVAGCGGYYVRFRAPYAAVSEGIGYGMLITVVMAGYDPNARTYFDGLVRFVRAHPAYNVDPALLDWRVNGDCSPGDGWAAPDGDLDIAMGLLMADRQWGSTGAINYKAEAIRVINALKAKVFNPLGYSMGGPAPDLSRTSDYMIGHFRAFKRATGDGYWDLAINKSFELMSLMQSRFAPNTGLIPDFIVGLPNNPAPSPGGRIESMTEGFYAWNACRIPWRLGTDYVTSGDTRSRDVAGKLMDFMNNRTGGNPILIPMGWRLDGTPLSTPDPYYSSPSFSGPAVAGALVDGRFQSFLNNLWTLNATHPATGYYDYELQLISMMVASGNWWNP